MSIKFSDSNKENVVIFDEKLSKLSRFINNMIEDLEDVGEVPMEYSDNFGPVGTEFLKKLLTLKYDFIVETNKKVKEENKNIVELMKEYTFSQEDLNFFDEVLKSPENNKYVADILFQMLNLSNSLDIECVLNFISKYIAEKLLSGKTTEEMGKILNLESDWTKEEWKQVLDETEWVDHVDN